ncbi:hypothetical protein DFJ74DRAFT_684805 [Hyaloraphidium curvatum]|nr:hypothetical protein DFJ74DRAFT_684805 [Hyaloraphidium curvatum]
MSAAPATMKAAVLSPPDDAKNPDYAVAAITDVPTPKIGKDDDVLIKLHAAALNHRDHWIRKLVYTRAATKFGSILAADGMGTVHSAGASPATQSLVGKRVMVNCSFGWEKDLKGPEAGDKYGLLGYLPLPGTLAEYLVVPAGQCKVVPEWMSDEEAAAIPLAALTAWRALFTKGGLAPTPTAGPKPRVLICGIGGGVALFALQFAVAAGAEVYVTSSSEDKIAKAKGLGAKGGVNYTKTSWPQDLLAAISAQGSSRRPGVEIIIDGAGFDVDGMEAVCTTGASIVTYGATAGQKQSISITPHFIKQIEWKGTAMGSNLEWDACVDFIAQHKIRPVVAAVFKGLEQTDAAFAEMAAGRQFGKLVVTIGGGAASL